jgi:hypothetical protein
VNVLPQRTYRDPLEQVLEAEEESCKGCRWRRMVDGALQCTNQRIRDPLRQDRCKHYEERA